jgi:hypothetical protein
MKTLREATTDLLEIAKQNLLDDGAVQPMLIRISGEPMIFSLAGVPKELWPMAAEAMVDGKTETLFHVNEAWMVRRSTHEDLPKRPASECEDRKEVVLVEAKNRKGELAVVSQEFDRDAQGKPFFASEPRWLTDHDEAKSFSRTLGGCFV